jgi:hypothetical protein
VTSPASRAPRPSSLSEVLEVVLDKGIVIDAYARVSAIGIELLTIDARIVIASVDTYLRFAEAVDRLELAPAQEPRGLPQLMEEGIETAAKTVVKKKLSRPADRITGFVEKVTGRSGDERG